MHVLQLIPVVGIILIIVVIKNDGPPKGRIVQHVVLAFAKDGSAIGRKQIVLHDGCRRAWLIGGEGIDAILAFSTAIRPLVAVSQNAIDLRRHLVVGAHGRNEMFLMAAVFDLERLVEQRLGSGSQRLDIGLSPRRDDCRVLPFLHRFPLFLLIRRDDAKTLRLSHRRHREQQCCREEYTCNFHVVFFHRWFLIDRCYVIFYDIA